MDNENIDNYSHNEEDIESVENNHDLASADRRHYSNNDSSVTMQPKNKKWKKYLIITSVLMFLIIVSLALIAGTFNNTGYNSDNKIAVIYLQGIVTSGSIPDGMGYVSSDEISEDIRKSVNDNSVKAIVLRINSPGGSSAASEEIYTEVKKAREKGKPVIVSMADVAASAAYHISAPANVIYANPSTMTGSIGVIWTFQNKSKYYKDEGIDFYIAKSGAFKDMGSDTRGLNESEKEYANSVISEVYESFVQHVAEERNMSVEQVKSIADGRIYTGKKAHEIGLIDELGDMYDAIDKAKELGKIQGEPNVIYMNKPSLSNLLFGSSSQQKRNATEILINYEKSSPYGHIS